MRSKSFLNMSTQPRYDQWKAAWDKYARDVRDNLPPAALELLGTYTLRKDKTTLKLRKKLLAAVGLDIKAWVAWGHLNWAAWPEFSAWPPAYHLTPACIPAPPCNPTKALALAHEWEYLNTTKGLARFDVASLLAQAAALSQLKDAAYKEFHKAWSAR